eukprot:225283-Lingulodinium_polyedra.AAC.1
MSSQVWHPRSLACTDHARTFETLQTECMHDLSFRAFPVSGTHAYLRRIETSQSECTHESEFHFNTSYHAGCIGMLPSRTSEQAPANRQARQ